MLDVQDGFLQKPFEQMRLLSQLLLLPQVPPQELGAPDGGVVGVPVGVGFDEPDGVSLGVPVGEAVGEPVGVPAANVNESEQLVTSCAWGTLDGAAGEIEVCLSW